jgi:hypothetical protein
VLLQRQRYKVSQLAWRRAYRQHARAAFWHTLTWLRRALTAHKKSEAVMNCSCAGCNIGKVYERFDISRHT